LQRFLDELSLMQESHCYGISMKLSVGDHQTKEAIKCRTR